MPPDRLDDAAAGMKLRSLLFVPADSERKFAKAMNAKTITIASSHVPMLSHPEEVAKFIAEAASTVAK